MAVKIRLQRGGAKHKPMYRMVVADSRSKRDGRFIEIIGAYDPKNKIEGRQVKVDLDRAAYWIGVGAQPSDTARTIINRAKREVAARGPDDDAGQKQPAKPAASKEEVLGGEQPPAPRTTPTDTNVAEGDAAAAAGEISPAGTPAPADAAEKEAREVAEKAADQSPTGEPVAGAGESGATATPPQEAEEAAREEEEKK